MERMKSEIKKEHDFLSPIILNGHSDNGQTLKPPEITILSPRDVFDSINYVKTSHIDIKCTILDPWYNKGFGGVRDDYTSYILSILNVLAQFSEHIFLWGFPEIVAVFVDKLPPSLKLVSWLTWYYKNTPSVIKGWRSSQNACLHLSQPGAKLYPENFMNDDQKLRSQEKKMRFFPGPTSVIEVPLLVGFVGKDEQTGHPSQKPVAVIEKLVLMSTQAGDTVFDPMCGSGTTGAVAALHDRKALLSDVSEEYTALTEKRLHLSRSTHINSILT